MQKSAILINANRSHILINANRSRFGFESDRIKPARHCLGLLTIHHALKKHPAAVTASLFPENYLPINSPADKREVYKELQRLSCLKHQNPIIGISSCSDDFPVAKMLAQFVREIFPGSPLVFGGPHFVREAGLGIKDPVQQVLENGLADAVVYRGAQPFVDLVLKTQHYDFKELNLPGLYYLNQGKIRGSGKGEMPAVDLAPYYTFESGGTKLAFVLLGNICSNQCGFCSVPAGFISSNEAVRSSLREIIQNEKADLLCFEDPNLLENPALVRDYLPYIQQIEKEAGRKPIAKTISLDPSLLCLGSGAELSPNIKALIKNNFRSFFLGRETTSGAEAGLLGSNYKKQSKSQSRLDNEKEDLFKFIKYLNEQRFSHACALTISYILNPFANQEQMILLIKEMAQFEALSTKYVKIGINPNQLIPYPGTQIRQKYLDCIDQPESNFDSWFPSNPWATTKLGPASRLILPLQTHWAANNASAYFQKYSDRIIEIINAAFDHNLSEEEIILRCKALDELTPEDQEIEAFFHALRGGSWADD